MPPTLQQDGFEEMFDEASRQEQERVLREPEPPLGEEPPPAQEPGLTREELIDEDEEGWQTQEENDALVGAFRDAEERVLRARHNLKKLRILWKAKNLLFFWWEMASTQYNPPVTEAEKQAFFNSDTAANCPFAKRQRV